MISDINSQNAESFILAYHNAMKYDQHIAINDFGAFSSYVDPSRADLSDEKIAQLANKVIFYVNRPGDLKTLESSVQIHINKAKPRVVHFLEGSRIPILGTIANFFAYVISQVYLHLSKTGSVLLSTEETLVEQLPSIAQDYFIAKFTSIPTPKKLLEAFQELDWYYFGARSLSLSLDESVSKALLNMHRTLVKAFNEQTGNLDKIEDIVPLYKSFERLTGLETLIYSKIGNGMLKFGLEARTALLNFPVADLIKKKLYSAQNPKTDLSFLSDKDLLIRIRRNNETLHNEILHFLDSKQTTSLDWQSLLKRYKEISLL